MDGSLHAVTSRHIGARGAVHRRRALHSAGESKTADGGRTKITP